MIFVDRLTQNDAVIVGSLQIENHLFPMLVLKHQILHRNHQIRPSKPKIKILANNLIQIFLVTARTLHKERLVVDRTVSLLAEGFSDDSLYYESRQANI